MKIDKKVFAVGEHSSTEYKIGFISFSIIRLGTVTKFVWGRYMQDNPYAW